MIRIGCDDFTEMLWLDIGSSITLPFLMRLVIPKILLEIFDSGSDLGWQFTEVQRASAAEDGSFSGALQFLELVHDVVEVGVTGTTPQLAQYRYEPLLTPPRNQYLCCFDEDGDVVIIEHLTEPLASHRFCDVVGQHAHCCNALADVRVARLVER
ncbi:hypothetical protein B0T44_23135 [Nocardia donostiensis]|uniref:Uncharacterized protein n=1 Tax=Nocardia donostiensis TaxID=1538463 RepID=A0A1V2TGX7_9NOCA|nr:hypothetical protein B0T46_11850 [Nocardia donostiensis]OQS16903.1 hypothetical protein B0T36_04525 [Nocardia donostiensis]OQS17779.1 hypothetical protein B0T44_23135 [Nocardia donostiensis]